MEFSGCNRWHDKIPSHLVLEWSHSPEKSFVMSGTPCTFWDYITFKQIQVGCWVTAWKVFLPPWWPGRLNFLHRVMGENELHEPLCHRGPDNPAGKKLDLVLCRGCEQSTTKLKICVEKKSRRRWNIKTLRYGLKILVLFDIHRKKLLLSH